MADNRAWDQAKASLAAHPRNDQAALELERIFNVCMHEMGMTTRQFGNHLAQVRYVAMSKPRTTLKDVRCFIELFKKMLELSLTPNLVEWKRIKKWHKLGARSTDHWRIMVDAKIRRELRKLARRQRRTVINLVDDDEVFPARPAGFKHAGQVDRFETGGERANIGDRGGFLPMVVGKQNDGDEAIIVQEHWLGPSHVGAFRELPDNRDHQVLVPFPEGPCYFPKMLVPMTTEERFNLDDEVVVFGQRYFAPVIPTHAVLELNMDSLQIEQQAQDETRLKFLLILAKEALRQQVIKTK